MILQGVAANELVALCLASGDLDAWQEFVRRTQRLIASVAGKVCRNHRSERPDLVDDLVQETYLRLCKDDFRVLRRFQPKYPDAIYAFVKVIASSVAHDHFRSSGAVKRGQKVTIHPDKQSSDRVVYERAADAMSIPADAERAVLIDQIRGVLERELPGADGRRQQQVFWLYFRDGLTAAQISAIPYLKLTTKGVESMLLRTTRVVREAIEPKATPATRKALLTAEQQLYVGEQVRQLAEVLRPPMPELPPVLKPAQA